MTKETIEVARLVDINTATVVSAVPAASIIEPDRQFNAEIAVALIYRAQAKAVNTLRAYTSAWNQFEGWCDERSLDPLPARPEAVATYLASLAL